LTIVVGAFIVSMAKWKWLDSRKNYRKLLQTCQHIRAPDSTPLPKDALSLFLGGGITNCPDWQSEIATKLQERCPSLVLVNPRRTTPMDIKDKNLSPVQIEWEYRRLREMSAIMFYFPKETLCPITLYELGSWMILSQQTNTKLFIQCHPEYARVMDVQVQVKLVNINIEVVVSSNFDTLLNQIETWYNAQM